MTRRIGWCVLIVAIIVVGPLFAGGQKEGASSSQAAVSAPGELPLVKTPTTLTALIEPFGNITDITTNAYTKWMEQKTGVHLDFQVVPQTADSSSKIALILSSGKLPDMIIGAAMPSGWQETYGGPKGVLLPLNDLIQQHGFYLKQVIQQDPAYLADSVLSDGQIYMLGAWEECYHCSVAEKMWMNTDWLKKLNLKMPTTTAEFENVLKAFKAGDPNGDGQADEIPLSGALNTWHSTLDGFLMNAFIYDDGQNRMNVDASGKVIPAFSQPQFREGLKYMHQLYAEGLLDPQAFVQNLSQLQQLVMGPHVLVGAAMVGHRGMMTTNEYSPQSFAYEVVPPLKGPNGVQFSGYFPYSPHTDGSDAAITRACKNPALAFKWLDYQFSQDASISNWNGIQGVDWNPAKPGEIGRDGKPALFEYVNGPQNNPVAQSQQNRAWVHTGPYFMPAHWFGGGAIEQGKFEYETFLYGASDPYVPFAPKIVMPNAMPFLPSDAKIVATMQQQMNDFVYSAVAKFTTGQLDITSDSDWQQYLDQLNSMGLPDYTKAYQNGFSLWKKDVDAGLGMLTSK
ncbi:MAG TPA: hypothetical protein VFH83_07440 [Spirochaetia bacterium]|nr:hypothetical protein [Spirochaetia bacterium]